MGTRAWIVVVLVVVVLLVAAATVEASSKPAPPSSSIGDFADAIADAEGFGTPGAIPTRANNPGDLALGGTTIGTAGITVFDSVADGWNALYAQLARIRDRRSGTYTPEMSIAVMATHYAPGDATTWATNVARALGVPTWTPIGDLLS